jgi:hypothetical protein
MIFGSYNKAGGNGYMLTKLRNNGKWILGYVIYGETSGGVDPYSHEIVDQGDFYYVLGNPDKCQLNWVPVSGGEFPADKTFSMADNGDAGPLYLGRIKDSVNYADEPQYIPGVIDIKNGRLFYWHGASGAPPPRSSYSYEVLVIGSLTAELTNIRFESNLEDVIGKNSKQVAAGERTYYNNAQVTVKEYVKFVEKVSNKVSNTVSNTFKAGMSVTVKGSFFGVGASASASASVERNSKSTQTSTSTTTLTVTQTTKIPPMAKVKVFFSYSQANNIRIPYVATSNFTGLNMDCEQIRQVLVQEKYDGKIYDCEPGSMYLLADMKGSVTASLASNLIAKAEDI